jgi:hypothetical protein
MTPRSNIMDWHSILSTLPVSVALALIFYQTLRMALRYHVQALHEQRADLLDHMRTACNTIKDKLPLVLAAGIIAAALPGCTYARFKHNTADACIVRFGIDTQIRDLHSQTSYGDKLDVGSVDEQSKLTEAVGLIAAIARGVQPPTVVQVQSPAPSPTTKPTR